MIRPFAALTGLIWLTSPALADVDAALDAHVLPGMDRLVSATATLADAPCDPAMLRPAFADAATAWGAVSHLTLGPAEEAGRAKAILHWPDERDATRRGLRLLLGQGEDAWTADALTKASVAARGLGALERLIWEEGAQPCALTRALTRDLATTALVIRDGWTDGFADLMRGAGSPGNTRFLDPQEAQAALFTALMTGLELTAEHRLGRPMGTFDRPRPARAELRRSQLSLPMVVASLQGLRGLAASLADAPETDAAFARALDAAAGVEAADLSGVSDPARRFRIEALQTAVNGVRQAADAEIGSSLGVVAGFNSADGD